MTQIFKKMLVGGMLAGLMVAPLGVAQAESHSGGENAAALEWTLPTVGLPELSITLNGEPHTIGGDDAIGGTLSLFFKASDWVVSYANAECLPDQIGKAISLDGKTPSAALSAVYTPLSGDPTGFDLSPVANRYPTAGVHVCI